MTATRASIFSIAIALMLNGGIAAAATLPKYTALRIIYRDEWMAQPPKDKPVPLEQPVPQVGIIDTSTDDCSTQVLLGLRNYCLSVSFFLFEKS